MQSRGQSGSLEEDSVVIDLTGDDDGTSPINTNQRMLITYDALFQESGILVRSHHIIAVENACKSSEPILLDFTRLSDKHVLTFAWTPSQTNYSRCVRLLDFLLGTLRYEHLMSAHLKVADALILLCGRRNTEPALEKSEEATNTLIKYIRSADLGKLRLVSYPHQAYDIEMVPFARPIDFYMLPVKLTCYRFVRSS